MCVCRAVFSGAPCAALARSQERLLLPSTHDSAGFSLSPPPPVLPARSTSLPPLTFLPCRPMLSPIILPLARSDALSSSLSLPSLSLSHSLSFSPSLSHSLSLTLTLLCFVTHSLTVTLMLTLSYILFHTLLKHTLFLARLRSLSLSVRELKAKGCSVGAQRKCGSQYGGRGNAVH